ncbi:hypothetical protein AAFF_G00350930 [Aldrovandia affinis]|uniref:Uncharacterized protein n=1 Tax=Aldrovandia affinis TaxID=143900 RepID=A0AAD7R5S0_9TELE|nr:hypothetical protein AAFF_G00350930 [Aldrovandia affinis]
MSARHRWLTVHFVTTAIQDDQATARVLPASKPRFCAAGVRTLEGATVCGVSLASDVQCGVDTFQTRWSQFPPLLTLLLQTSSTLTRLQP